jgi:hypothetical protein
VLRDSGWGNPSLLIGGALISSCGGASSWKSSWVGVCFVRGWPSNAQFQLEKRFIAAFQHGASLVCAFGPERIAFRTVVKKKAFAGEQTAQMQLRFEAPPPATLIASESSFVTSVLSVCTFRHDKHIHSARKWRIMKAEDEDGYNSSRLMPGVDIKAENSWLQ